MICACVLGKSCKSNWNILYHNGKGEQHMSIIMQHNGEMCTGGSCTYLPGMISKNYEKCLLISHDIVVHSMEIERGGGGNRKSYKLILTHTHINLFPVFCLG